MMSSLHRLSPVFRDYSSKYGGVAEVTSFRGKASPGHNAQTPAPAWERNCYSRARGSIAEICGAQRAKTDIEWF
jgi:hypothetical protein